MSVEMKKLMEAMEIPAHPKRALKESKDQNEAVEALIGQLRSRFEVLIDNARTELKDDPDLTGEELAERLMFSVESSFDDLIIREVLEVLGIQLD